MILVGQGDSLHPLKGLLNANSSYFILENSLMMMGGTLLNLASDAYIYFLVFLFVGWIIGFHYQLHILSLVLNPIMVNNDLEGS